MKGSKSGAAATTAPMTICFINSTRKWGGVKTWTLDFGKALKERGHSIVCIVRPQTPFAGACKDSGFETYPVNFGPKCNPFAILKLIRIMKRERPSVAVVNISKDLNIGAVAAKLLGIPVLHRVGLIEDYRGSREERWIHFNLVDRLLVPSQYLKSGLIDRFSWMNSNRISVVPNSKRLDKFPLGAKENVGEKVRFGVSSQLSSSKGHRYLLAAIKTLCDKGLQVELLAAGAGPLEEELRLECQKRGIADRVEFVGFQKNIPEFLSQLDAYVLPSLKESFSNAMLEAMCMGLPVVAAASGGIPEVLGDAGILVPPAEVEPLAEAMEKIALDVELRSSLGKKARERAEQHFNLLTHAEELERLLLSMTRK